MNETASAPGQEAIESFRRDLPRLLRERPGQWVAYHGGQVGGVASGGRALYQECLRRGIPGTDFIVRCIEPQLPEVVESPYPVD